MRGGVSRALHAGGDSQRFGQTPGVIESSIGPPEHVESSARRGHWHALHGDVFQYLRTDCLAFGSKLFRRLFEGLEDGRIGFRFRVLRSFEPGGQRPGARLESGRGLPIAGDRRDARQVVVKLREMVEGVAEPDEAGPDCAQVGGFQRERFQEVLDLLNRLAGGLVGNGFAG